MNRFAMVGLSAVLALGACAQPQTADQARGADAVEAKASLRTVQLTVTGMT